MGCVYVGGLEGFGVVVEDVDVLIPSFKSYEDAWMRAGDRRPELC